MNEWNFIPHWHCCLGKGEMGLRDQGSETKIQGHLQTWVKGKVQVFPVKFCDKSL